MPRGVYAREPWMKSSGSLSPQDKEEIRVLRARGETLGTLAQVFKVSRGAICLVLRGEWNPKRSTT